MIYTVTLNPALDYIIDVPGFAFGKTNRTEAEVMFPGGKGINVSKNLNALGVDTIALGFVAGHVGNMIRQSMKEEGIPEEFVEVDGESRINVKIRNIEGTEINGRGPEIDRDDVDRLLDKLNTLTLGDILVIGGRIPEGVSEDIYYTIMNRLEDRGIEFIVDTTGQTLRNVLYFNPFLLKPNMDELGGIFNVFISTKEEAAFYAEKLCEMGAKNVIVSMASEGAIMVTREGEYYEAKAPEHELVNSVGSGDAMIAGFLQEYLESGDKKRAFEKAVCVGSAAAYKLGYVTKEEADKLYEEFLGN